MPLHVKSISISLAVVFFFMISVIGSIAGLTPFVCCKRALIGSTAAYIVTSFVVRMVNRILIEAMVQAKMNQENGDVSARGN